MPESGERPQAVCGLTGGGYHRRKARCSKTRGPNPRDKEEGQ